MGAAPLTQLAEFRPFKSEVRVRAPGGALILSSLIRLECKHMFVPSARQPPPVPLVKRAGRPPSATRLCPVEVRHCRHHGWTEFAHYSAGPGRGRRWSCKRCVGEAVTRRKQKVKRLLVEEAGGCCALCGYNRCIINLVFHHVDPSQKRFALSSNTTKSLATYRDELAKCVLLCANCHGEVEAGVVESPQAGARYAGPATHLFDVAAVARLGGDRRGGGSREPPLSREPSLDPEFEPEESEPESRFVEPESELG
jgi:hypothetical protein